MSRTMTEKEHEELKNIIESKKRELVDKKDIIDYFHRAGFCDEKGLTVYPYNNRNKR